jgi:hypothetical protein
MGCNFSTSAAPPPAGGRGSPVGAGRAGGGAQQGPGLGGGNPHNRRVKALAPWSWEAGPVSLTELASKRATFWEAQTAGRRLIWENLKVGPTLRDRAVC